MIWGFIALSTVIGENGGNEDKDEIIQRQEMNHDTLGRNQTYKLWVILQSNNSSASMTRYFNLERMKERRK